MLRGCFFKAFGTPRGYISLNKRMVSFIYILVPDIPPFTVFGVLMVMMFFFCLGEGTNQPHDVTDILRIYLNIFVLYRVLNLHFR